MELRPLRADDYHALYAVAADPLIWEQHPVKDRHREDVFRGFFEEQLASGGGLVVVDTQTGDVIGTSRYYGYDPERSEIEIGWTFLARSHWGGTYNRELKQLMLRHAFRFVRSVVFLVDPENIRSQRSVEKIGGVHVGSRPGGGGRPSVAYRITASEFERWSGAMLELAGAIDVVVRPHRGLDLGAASFEGQPFAWLTPLGEDAPTVAGDWWASWGGGLMTTCGLDNVGEPADGLPLHGTYNYLLAQSVEADGNRISGTVADARGVVVLREIVNDPDRGRLRLTDRMSNTSGEPQPAPLLYHCNLLWGEVDIDSDAVEPRDAVSAAGDWRVLGAGAERVYEHLGAQRSRVRVGGLIVEIRSSLPRLWQWVSPERGVLGIEPANCSVRGRAFDASEGRLPILEPGEARESWLEISVAEVRKCTGAR